MGMDSDYGRPIEPLSEAIKKPFRLDSIATNVGSDGTDVVEIGGKWYRVTPKGEIGDQIPDIEALKPFK